MKRLALFIFVVGLLSSCANIIPPSGGDKDTLAPQVIRSMPENGSTNVNGNQIYLEFSEEIDATKLESEMDIVPHYKGELKIISKKKNVTIRFLEPLDSNTTYTLNFGNGITDITERNPTKGLSYSFSTGPTIDSIVYSGSINWLPVAGSSDKTMVGLYQAGDTASPYTSKPYYYTYASTTNKFRLHHLKEGKYKVYTWVDKNDNGILDPESEVAGYRKEDLQLDSNVTKDSLVLFTPKNSLPAVNSTRYQSSFNTIKLNKSLQDYKVLDGNELINSFGNTPKEIVFYSNSTIKDSIKIHISLTDSSGQEKTELVTLFFDEKYPGERENKSSSKNQLSTQIQYVDAKPKLIIKTDNPILHIDTQQVRISQKGKLIHWNANESELDSKNKTLTINNLDVKYGDTLEVKFINNSYPKPYNNKSDTLTTKELIPAKDRLASLGIRIITDEKNYIIQIINKENKIVISESNPKELKYQVFEPGIYKMRVIIDTNGNGKWDTGNKRT